MTPSDLLRALRGRGGSASGEALALDLGVTRAAVAKHVAALRERGWRIAARRRVGYALEAAPDLLDADVVMPLLGTRWLGRDWRWHERTDSTNDDAKAAAEARAPHGTVVVAEAQDRGRGRLGRVWHSPPGENLCFSAVLRPDLAPAAAPPVTLAAGVAVAEAVEEAGVAGASLKWPNDVRVGGRKLAGILTEMAAEADRVRYLVVGAGVNVNTTRFPDEIAAIATSLRIALGRKVDRPEFCAALCARLEAWLDRFFTEGAAPVIAAFRRRAELPRAVRVDTGRGFVEGQAEDVDDSGALLVRTASGAVERVTSGEIA